MKYIGIIGIIILILGGWLFVNRAEAPTTTDDGAVSAQAQETGAQDPEASTNNVVGVEEPGAGEDIFAALVTYTDSGFEPAVVTIKKGETVRFVDQSTNGMWVGSAKHPTHAEYPQKSDTDCLGSSFDTCRVLLPGEFWEFTFDEVGTWKYHNHVYPSHTGTVVVEE